MHELPIVDLAQPLERVGPEVDRACRDVGFLIVTGHGVDPELIPALRAHAAAFFSLPDETKRAIAMAHGGAAWRGWFPLHGELTSGIPDDKEGLYFGTELAPDDPRVTAGTPLHGPNLFPDDPSELRPLVLATIAALQSVASRVVEAMAVGLGMPRNWFATHVTADPTVLFRIFRYPARTSRLGHDQWGVREHTDYGLVTVLAHDGTPGLEVHTGAGWIAAPTQTDAFIVNVGDMLEKLTAGRYRSTPHRVTNPADHDRYSFPLFFDPGWRQRVVELPLDVGGPAGRPRWDGENPLAWEGTYGDYLTSRVARVFPDLFERLRDREAP
jgi:isopenicillin N synthase-like dioxygenase